jgi:5-methylcytosine-specific restriction endonuclease McrA
MASSPNYVRNYQQEYKTETKKRRHERALRNRARRALVKRFGKTALRGKDVDHRIPLDKGGSNALSNLRPLAPRNNRSFRRNSKGGMK